MMANSVLLKVEVADVELGAVLELGVVVVVEEVVVEVVVVVVGTSGKAGEEPLEGINSNSQKKSSTLS